MWWKLAITIIVRVSVHCTANCIITEYSVWNGKIDKTRKQQMIWIALYTVGIYIKLIFYQQWFKKNCEELKTNEKNYDHQIIGQIRCDDKQNHCFCIYNTLFMVSDHVKFRDIVQYLCKWHSTQSKVPSVRTCVCVSMNKIAV